jgi:hypothetical protein
MRLFDSNLKTECTRVTVLLVQLTAHSGSRVCSCTRTIVPLVSLYLGTLTLQTLYALRIVPNYYIKSAC